MTKPQTDIFEASEIASLGTSAKKVVAHLDVGKARTVTITIKGTTNASATSGIRLNVYYSPTGEGEDWDSVPFGTFDLNLTAGSKTQETHNFDVPEHGFIKIEAENLDATYTATLITIWHSIRRWTGV